MASSAPLHEAINTLSLDALRRALADDPESANAIHEGLTPLMLLAGKKPQIEDYERLKTLGLANRDTTEQVVRNRTLHIYETMAKFIAVCPSINLDATNDQSRTALHMAAEQANEDLLNVLIDAGADLNKQDDQGKTPLMVASTFTVRRILTYAGADLTLQDLAGNTVLHLLLQDDLGDPASSALISKALPSILLVKNKEGFTPEELADKKAKQINERFAHYQNQELTRKKADWEESFGDTSASDIYAEINEGCTKPIPIQTPPAAAVTVSKPTIWRRIWMFCCCFRRTLKKEDKGIPKGGGKKVIPSYKTNITDLPSMKVSKEILLKGTRFVDGPEEPIQKREKKPIVIEEFKHFSNEIAAAHVPPEQERTEFSAPLHRQSNFTTEEPTLLQQALQQQRQELDEVFQILNQSQTTPQQNPQPTATAEMPQSLPPEVGLPSDHPQPQSADAEPVAESAEH